MLSSQKLPTGLTRLIPAAALLAALFVPLVAASAGDDCPPGGCPLPPPQSREVNPSPARADGSAVEVPKAAELPPVEITVHVLAPTFIQPAPVGASFGAVSVPVRYQREGDVSCGVQALGMAMDALPGAAPTSASLLGLLEDNGMMYDFGTGVEELAFAAQSFGYTGSFGFHGATMDQLRGQLATGGPVVVSLGTDASTSLPGLAGRAGSAGSAGHFATVTGVSSDGQWVAYNDPTLGEQVMSATEFERLWGLQGNSGVVVATEPPPASGVDAGVLSLWVAFAAGVMALVSTTPLAKFRQGIGGMLDAGGGGSYTPIRSAPKSSPPEKEKEKEKEKDKPPKTSKARFDEEIVMPATPPKATTARFDAEISLPSTPVSKVVLTPTEAKAGTGSVGVVSSYPQPRFDEEPPPAGPTPSATPAPVATPSEQRAARATATPAPSIERDASYGSFYAPTAATQGAPKYAGTAAPGALTGGDWLVALPPLPDKYLKYLPTSTLPEWDERTLYVPLGILEMGMHDAFHAGVPANDNLRLTPTKSAFTLGNTSVKIGWGGSSVEVGFRTPRRPYSVVSTGATMAVGQSGSLSVTWDGWNTITKAAYNPVDYTVSGPDDREVIYGSGIHGVYVEEKPIQVATFSEIAVAFLGLAFLAPPIGAKALELMGNGLNPVPVRP